MNDIQKKLLEKRKIDILGKIEPDTIKYVREAFQALTLDNSPSITLTITSGGGDADVGLDICDLLKFYTGHKIGVVHGYANSMASIILQVCDWRVITPNAHILIHHIRCSGFPLAALRDEKKLQEFIKDKLWLYHGYEILSARTKKSLEEIFAECEKDKSMDAERSLAFGLVDQIIETEAEIKPPWQDESKK